MSVAPLERLDLSASRVRIDEIDAAITALFQERMRVSADVAAYKKKTGKAVLDPKREQEKLSRALAMADEEFRAYIPSLFNLLMEMSRSYQQTLLSDIPAQVPESAPALDMPDAALVAFPHEARVCAQGVEGAYSHVAALQFFQKPDIEFSPSFSAVCERVANGEVDFGILPLENSTAGTVNAVYDALVAHNLHVVRSLSLRIEHDLVAKPGCNIDEVTSICSHEQALRQCMGYIESLPHEVASTIYPNTAMAALAVSESADPNMAAISSALAAKLYGLEVIASNIQDASNNYTRFVCVTRDDVYYRGADRASFVLTTPHDAGALYRVLSCFVALGINMLKLESRPIPGRAFEFMFYIDVAINPESHEYELLMRQLPRLCEMCIHLGTYTEREGEAQ